MPGCLHACTHVCTHAHMHTCTHTCTHTYMHICISAYMHTSPCMHRAPPDLVVIEDGDSEMATEVDVDSPAGSEVFDPESPGGSPAPASPAASVVFSPGSPPPPAAPVLSPVFSPPLLAAPANFWASDFDHKSMTGLIGLPAPGYALAEFSAPPPPSDPVPSSQPLPAASVWPAPVLSPPPPDVAPGGDLLACVPCVPVEQCCFGAPPEDLATNAKPLQSRLGGPRLEAGPTWGQMHQVYP